MTARWLARLLLGITIGMVALFVYLSVTSSTFEGPLDYDNAPAVLGYGLVALLFPLIGALVAARQPSNAIGWMFCAVGVALSAALCTQLYGERALYGPQRLPLGEVAVWASTWLFPVGLFVTPIFLLFLFPTGRPHARWSRAVVWVGAVTVALGFTGAALTPGEMPPPELKVTNPFGLPGTAGEVAAVVATFGAEIAALPFFLLGVVALIARMRRARGIERQQLKLFAFVASFMGVCFFFSFVFSDQVLDVPSVSDAFFVVGGLALLSIPVVSGLAILRYRLYDIDVVINKALVYGALTAFLGVAYVGCVALLQAILPTEGNDLAVAASTLAAAALFAPLRRRIQEFVDHRFYRRRYDAAHTIEQFSARLRDEVDLEELRSDLLQVVSSTMQPAHASLWIRKEMAT